MGGGTLYASRSLNDSRAAPLAFLLLTAWTVGYAVYDARTREPALWGLATIAVGVPLARLLPARDPGESRG